MTLVTQGPHDPGTILAAIKTAASRETKALVLTVAYTTAPGVDLLIRTLIDAMGAPRFRSIDKSIVTSFDFMHTEPLGLQKLLDSGFEISIARVGNSSYHPKVYFFDVGDTANAVVGSANLTRRALTVNSEAAVLLTGQPTEALRSRIDGLRSDSVPLTTDLLAEYEAARAAAPKVTATGPQLPDGVKASPAEAEVDQPVVAALAGATLVSLAEAVERGLNLTTFSTFWVDGGSFASGGSHNQLEMSRPALGYFGQAALQPTADHTVFDELLLRANGHSWPDRKLTFHGAPGENQMVRLNLPTKAQGGYEYRDYPILLFTRDADGYQLVAAPRGDDLAVAWRNASIASRHLYRVGQTGRECGLF